MQHTTLMAVDIKELLHAMSEVTTYHRRSLQPKEIKLLENIGNRLRDQESATLTVKQASGLTAILAQAPKRTAKARTKSAGRSTAQHQEAP